MNEKRPWLQRLFVPQYDEIALFLMSFSFILLFITHEDLRAGALFMVFTESPLIGLLALFFFGQGIVFSLYHVFTSREKTWREIKYMLVSAVIINAAGGIATGMYFLEHPPHGLLILFPLWNIINGFLLLLLYRFDLLDDAIIVDDNAGRIEVVAGICVVLMTFAIGTFVFELYWAVIFSICMAYATNINALVRYFISENVR